MRTKISAGGIYTSGPLPSPAALQVVSILFSSPILSLHNRSKTPRCPFEEKTFKFQLCHGSAQLYGGLTRDAQGIREGAQEYVASLLSDETFKLAASTTDAATIYIHTAPDPRRGGVSVFAWWSPVGDPTVIDPPSVWINHLDHYRDCVYVQEKERAHIEIPDLLEPMHRARLEVEAGSTFVEAVLNRNGRTSRLSTVEVSLSERECHHGLIHINTTGLKSALAHEETTVDAQLFDRQDRFFNSKDQGSGE